MVIRKRAVIGLLFLGIVLRSFNLVTTVSSQDRTGDENMMATRAIPVASHELASAIAIRGTARALPEQPVTNEGSVAPHLYHRPFEITDMSLFHGDAADLGSTLTIRGITMFAVGQRIYDPRNFVLDLNGQSFFDAALPSESVPVLILIGGAVHETSFDGMTNNATVQGGSYDGQPARVFLLDGVNSTLDKAITALVGWQSQRSLETAKAAIKAPHPLIAVDALRVAVQESAFDQVEYLSQQLLHPAQPTGVKTNAIQLLGFAINKAPTDTAARLIDIAIHGWEDESAAQLLSSYLTTFRGAAGQINEADRAPQIRDIAGDFQLQQLLDLSQEVIDGLNKE